MRVRSRKSLSFLVDQKLYFRSLNELNACPCEIENKTSRKISVRNQLRRDNSENWTNSPRSIQRKIMICCTFHSRFIYLLSSRHYQRWSDMSQRRRRRRRKCRAQIVNANKNPLFSFRFDNYFISAHSTAEQHSHWSFERSEWNRDHFSRCDSHQGNRKRNKKEKKAVKIGAK